MDRRAALFLLIGTLTTAVLTPVAPARAANLSVSLNRVATGLDRPVAIAAPRDGSGRLFIVEREGRIRIFKDGQLRSDSYINITGKVKCCSWEEGMLGLVFHPYFKDNGRFYVTYTDNDGDLRLSKFVDPSPSGNYAPESSEDVLLQINHRARMNHWGGQLNFWGRLLYMSTGDGGLGQSDNAQDKNSLLGKVLRLDVARKCGSLDYCIPSSNPYAGSTPGRGEIWHRGLRNPWKFSFDRSTGYMWIGDVGEKQWEEVNRATTGGRNFGWDCREGFSSYTGCSGAFTNPVKTYSHSSGRCAIIGGYVVRGGSFLSNLQAWYVFGDYCTGEIFAMRRTSEGVVTDKLYDHGRNIVAFGEAQSGNIYMASTDGSSGYLYRLEQ